ncbi:hypothetical protein Vadar_018312 [Vaccinium darrowii]|uniref:Uncharacterized protein n=1 Tax=Vaccinium darrowii TaxID=229202 RepID=A0ACB7ZL33_9ERIC|nr:hypothetical protein Vadar_018312 [Vaccinium darrowii]
MVTQLVASSSYGNDLLTAPRSPRPTHTDQIYRGDLSNDDELDLPMSLGVPAPTHINLRRHYLGKMDTLCPKCLALHWMEERLTKSSRSSPVFGTCCLEGKVKLHLLITPHPPLQALYDGNDD